MANRHWTIRAEACSYETISSTGSDSSLQRRRIVKGKTVRNRCGAAAVIGKALEPKNATASHRGKAVRGR